MIRLSCSLIVLLILVSGCAIGSTSPTGKPTSMPDVRTPTPTPANDDEAIRFLIQAEGEGVVAKDIDRLMELWAQDGYVVDANHTSADTSDDLSWKGWYAVRDRYITLVFPGNPSFAQPSDLSITTSGDHAVVTSTTRIGAEVSPAGDRWTCVRTPAGWRIESLTYNLEPR